MMVVRLFRRLAPLPALLCLALAGAPAWAARISASITDETGQPLANAVVTVTPAAATPVAAGVDPRLATATIDQKDEMFMPEVVVIHAGGGVIFRDSDQVRHHVYSFSPIKQFEFVQHPGDVSAPVRFDTPGIAAIGCNIHDSMIAYVFVTDAPWATVTAADGKADFTGLAAGHYTVTVWHPRLWPDSPPQNYPFAVQSGDATLPVALRVMPRPVQSPNRLY